MRVYRICAYTNHVNMRVSRICAFTNHVNMRVFIAYVRLLNHGKYACLSHYLPLLLM